eukprot:UN01814
MLRIKKCCGKNFKNTQKVKYVKVLTIPSLYFIIFFVITSISLYLIFSYSYD